MAVFFFISRLRTTNIEIKPEIRRDRVGCDPVSRFYRTEPVVVARLDGDKLKKYKQQD